MSEDRERGIDIVNQSESEKDFKFEEVKTNDGVKGYKIVRDYTKHQQAAKRAKLRKKRK